jgi:F-type H+-transporting ATPase subunit b
MATPSDSQHSQSTGIQVPTADEHGHGGGAFPPFDPSTFAPQLIWLAITFAALYFVMSRIALPNIGSVLEERRDRIKRDLDQAERMKAETDAALKAYEQALADARGKAQGIAKETRDTLAAETEGERQRADQQIAVKVAETEKRIGETKVRALASVSEIAVDTAGYIVSQLIGKDVPAAEIKAALTSKPGA